LPAATAVAVPVVVKLFGADLNVATVPEDKLDVLIVPPVFAVPVVLTIFSRA
jgi:hypothetical protein